MVVLWQEVQEKHMISELIPPSSGIDGRKKSTSKMKIEAGGRKSRGVPEIKRVLVFRFFASSIPCF